MDLDALPIGEWVQIEILILDDVVSWYVDGMLVRRFLIATN